MKIKTISNNLMIILFVFLLGCQAEGQETLSTTEFKDILKTPEIQLVDMRTAEEFKTGYIENALNIDFKDHSFLVSMLKLEKEKPLAIYCKDGDFNKQAMKVLSDSGFKKIYALKGGLKAWEKGGNTLVIPKPIVPAKLNYSIKEFEELVLSENLVVVEFSAVWCGPCKLLKPIMDKLNADYAKKNVKIITIDVDESRALSNNLLVNEIPLILFYKNGKLLETMIGFSPEITLKNNIDKYL